MFPEIKINSEASELSIKIMKLKNKYIDKQYVSMKANHNYNLAMNRAGKSYPNWAKNNPSHVKKILDFYMTAVINNLNKEFHEDYWEVDHIIPLRGENISGLHVWWNLVLLPKFVNQAKNNKLVNEWANNKDFVFDGLLKGKKTQNNFELYVAPEDQLDYKPRPASDYEVKPLSIDPPNYMTKNDRRKLKNAKKT